MTKNHLPWCGLSLHSVNYFFCSGEACQLVTILLVNFCYHLLSCWRKSLPMPSVFTDSLCFQQKHQHSGLDLGIRIRDRDLLSVFHMWTFRFPSAVDLGDSLSFNIFLEASRSTWIWFFISSLMCFDHITVSSNSSQIQSLPYSPRGGSMFLNHQVQFASSTYFWMCDFPLGHGQLTRVQKALLCLAILCLWFTVFPRAVLIPVPR